MGFIYSGLTFIPSFYFLQSLPGFQPIIQKTDARLPGVLQDVAPLAV